MLTTQLELVLMACNRSVESRPTLARLTFSGRAATEVLELGAKPDRHGPPDFTHSLEPRP